MLKAEQETICTFDASDPIATVTTCQKPIIRRLLKLCEQHPDEYRLIQENRWGVFEFQMPQSLIRFAKPVSQARREASRKNALKHGFSAVKSRAGTAADDTDKELQGDD